MTKSIPKLLAFSFAALLIFGCDQLPENKDKEEETPTNAVGRAANTGTPATAKANTGSTAKAEEVATTEIKLPLVGAINLSGIGQTSSASLALSGSDEECDNDNWGVMGLALGAICHMGGMAHEMVWGEASGDYSCDDVRKDTEDEKGFGILHNLLCQDIFLQNDEVINFGMSEGTDNFAISFEDFDDGDANGHWTVAPTALGTYPANITVWHGSSDYAALLPFINFDLPEEINVTDGIANGTFYIDGTPFSNEMGFVMKAKIESEYHSANADCSTTPSKANCDFMDVKMWSGEGLISDGPPNGFRFKLGVDDRSNPTFYAMEGRYYYSPESGAQFTEHLGGTVSEVYIQFIQKNGYFRALFDFMDTEGNTLSKFYGNTDILAMLSGAEGVCQHPSSDDWIDDEDEAYANCPTLANYSDFWEGKEAFTAIKADPRDITQLDIPPVNTCTTTAGTYELEDCFGEEVE